MIKNSAFGKVIQSIFILLNLLYGFVFVCLALLSFVVFLWTLFSKAGRFEVHQLSSSSFCPDVILLVLAVLFLRRQKEHLDRKQKYYLYGLCILFLIYSVVSIFIFEPGSMMIEQLAELANKNQKLVMCLFLFWFLSALSSICLPKIWNKNIFLRFLLIVACVIITCPFGLLLFL